MSVLVLNYGVTNFAVQCQRGGHALPRVVGMKSDSFAGTETSSIRAELMVVPVVLTFLSAADAATVRALFALGAQVPCRGDVFNKGAVTIVCSGMITDEVRQDAVWWELSLTLYEIGTTLGYTPASTTCWLTGVVSDQDPGDSSLYIASLVSSNPGDSYIGIRVLDAETGLECGSLLSPNPAIECTTHTSSVPERSWLTRPLAAGRLTGSPLISVNSKGGTGDWLAHQGCLFKMYQWRAGVNIAGPYLTSYGGNGGFAGGDVETTIIDALMMTIAANDRLLFQLWGRIALHSGYADANDGSNLYRQTVYHGKLGGPPGVSWATLTGSVAEL